VSKWGVSFVLLLVYDGYSGNVMVLSNQRLTVPRTVFAVESFARRYAVKVLDVGLKLTWFLLREVLQRFWQAIVNVWCYDNPFYVLGGRIRERMRIVL